jgi:hypothetical protein
MRRRIRGILMTGKQFSLDSRMDLVQGIMSHGGVRHTSEPTSALPLMKEDSVEGVDSGQKPTATDYYNPSVKWDTHSATRAEKGVRVQ